MNRIVVVGYGPTAHRLVETLTSKGFSGSVTVIGEEPRPAYDRVHLTSYLNGTSAEDLTYTVPGGVVTRLNTRVTAIDRQARRVTLADGGSEPYDVLVLATGSAPFVPPVPGAEHAFVYRTIEDLDAIRTAAKDAEQGVVVGGGLLGLEAADALRALGLKTHIVEMSPWLMPRQVDEGGGSVLKSHIEGLGLTVHAGAGVQEIVHAGGEVSGLRKPDGTLIDAQVVVFSAGIRPRDELARDAGLEVGPRGGIVVDAAMRTSDPAVYAVGECALAGGMVYGLVGPCQTMAEVAADQIMGGTATFGGADLSTKLKLLGVEVAQFGAMEGALDVTYLDPVAGIYKKLFISDDARTLLGGICVGDAAPYTSLRPFVGKELPASPSDLLFSGAGAGLDLPDDAQVCSCNNVCAGDIRTAIADGSATDVPAIKACTRAGTTCGSCVPMLKQLLEKSGVEVSKALCEHFTYSRAELFDIVRVRGITTFSELISQHGQGRGCDICKPAVASILASLHNGHVLEGERAALQDTNDAFLANIQKNGTYSVVPRIPGGEITPRQAHRDRRGGPRLRPLHQDHRRAAHRPVRRPGRAAAGDLAAARGRRVRVGPRVRQGPAYREVLRRLHLVPLRRPGLRGHGHRAGAALPRPALAAQAQVRRLRLRPRMRRGPLEGLRRHRHRAGLEPVRRRQRRLQAPPRRPARQRPHHRRTAQDHRPLPDVLHPHRRPAAAHRRLDRVTGRRPRLPT
ncbi:hypothetical protein GCM10020001_018010 [Nonomuraea salmonea]